jgi:UDP-glucose 4-epimerase
MGGEPLKILVTGGAGFIGSHLVERLLDAGHDVVVLDDFSTGRERNLSYSSHRPNFELVRADIRKIPHSVVKRLGRVNRVCHLAAFTSVRRSVRQPVFTTEVNVTGTLNVLDTAARLKSERVVIASSAAVYGTPKAFPIVEDANIAPTSPYGASKAASELYCRSFEENHGIEAVCLRYFNVYGPRQTAGQYAGVIPIFAKRILRKQPLVIFGDGSQSRDFIFVSDVVEATIAALERNVANRVFNLGSGNETSVLELAETMRRITFSQSELEFLPPQAGDIARSVADITMARKELGLVARTSFEDGLSATIQWFKKRN